ncbi:MAG: c-type cytochrome [Caldimonas sp.]
MTDAHEPNEIDGPHEGPIKTPKQLILAVFYAFVVPIFAIVLLVMYVTSENRPAAGSDALTPQAVAERIKPFGRVEVKDLSDAASMKTGEQVFAGQCTACHTAGTLGAPKLGDAAAWAARIKTGYDALLHSALAGKNQMPAQGGGDVSDFEIGRAVVYMANQSGGKLAEPAAPAAGASAPAAPTADAAPPATGASATLVAAAPATAPAPPSPPAATTLAAAPAAAKTDAGAPPALYAQICMACHAAGVAGAPKLGDKAAWAPRIAQGIDALTASALKGKGAMPPKGGSTASEAELKAVVSYMVGTAR